MKAKDFISKLESLPQLNVTEGLKKEISTTHIGQRAVLVTTTQLDLDTDGGNDPSIQWESTHQSDTSLHWPKGSPVDSNASPFVVIPGGGWSKRHNIKFGDVGFAQIDSCPNVVPVIVADGGPKNKIGEGSIALFRAFGEERIKNHKVADVGLDSRFRMLIFPNSGDGVCHGNLVNESKATKLFNAL